MPQRQRLNPAVRRELLLDAAARAFGRLGYEATRVEDIADEAGGAKGLLYRHFATKEDLFRALMARKGEHCAEGLQDRLGQALDSGAGTADVVRKGLEGLVTMILDEVTSGTRVGNPAYEDGARLYHDRVRSVVVDAIRSASPATSEATAWLVAAALEGAGESAVLTWAEGKARDLSQDEAVGLLVTFCAAGLRAALDG